VQAAITVLGRLDRKGTVERIPFSMSTCGVSTAAEN
jgi:hypothetical protein